MATQLTSDTSVILPHKILAQALVQQLRALLDAFERFDVQIAAFAQTLPDTVDLRRGLAMKPLSDLHVACWRKSLKYLRHRFNVLITIDSYFLFRLRPLDR
jgi:hypothetical protein